jgi:hypothetical protein
MKAAIIGPAAGMVAGVMCYLACVGLSLRRGVDIAHDVFGGLAVAAFAGGLVGYWSVVWLGLVAL